MLIARSFVARVLKNVLSVLCFVGSFTSSLIIFPLDLRPRFVGINLKFDLGLLPVWPSY